LYSFVSLVLIPIQSRFYLGDVGNGAAMKLVVNMIMGRLAVRFIWRLNIT
jgi:3-hydroxyisobutyrate dehydrogenase-like beta-hydroxyacid dehydrogenase